jgi:hypothetical protein
MMHGWYRVGILLQLPYSSPSLCLCTADLDGPLVPNRQHHVRLSRFDLTPSECIGHSQRCISRVHRELLPLFCNLLQPLLGLHTTRRLPAISPASARGRTGFGGTYWNLCDKDFQASFGVMSKSRSALPRTATPLTPSKLIMVYYTDIRLIILVHLHGISRLVLFPDLRLPLPLSLILVPSSSLNLLQFPFRHSPTMIGQPEVFSYLHTLALAIFGCCRFQGALIPEEGEDTGDTCTWCCFRSRWVLLTSAYSG